MQGIHFIVKESVRTRRGYQYCIIFNYSTIIGTDQIGPGSGGLQVNFPLVQGQLY